MTDSATTGKTVSRNWLVPTLLAVLALLAGVWLGRVAFVSEDTPSPQVVDITVLDTDLEVGGRVEYLDEKEVYILSVWTMPPAPDGSVYQVWMQVDDIIVSAGLMNSNSSRFAYAAYEGRYDTLFITEEPGPFGSQQPTSDPEIEADLADIVVAGEGE